MSKNDNLLTEGQVRQFMKLANLTPLTPGFVHGLRETADEAYVNEESTEEKAASVRQGIKDLNKTKGVRPPEEQAQQQAAHRSRLADASKYLSEPSAVSAEQEAHAGKEKAPPRAKVTTPDDEIKIKQESHGRGRGEGAAGYGHPDDGGRAGARLREAGEYDEDELENAEDDLEHADDLDIDAEEDLGDVGLDMGPDEGGREVSVDDFLVALEQALESVLGDEVEVEQDEEEDEEIELPLEGGEELDVGVEEEPPLQEMINTITKRVAKRIVREALQNKK